MLDRSRASDERGQGLLVFILAITVMFVVGAIAIDVGLWLSEKRGSQTDADFAALSGAWELADPGASALDARSAAAYALAGNDEQLNASFITTPEVDMATRCVTVDVKHDSRALFFQYFGVGGDPEIGAHAKACAGALQAAGDLVPFHVADNPGPCFTADEEPIFTALCPVENGAHAGNPRGLLDMDAGPYCSNKGNSGDPEEIIENGAAGLCLIDQDGVCDGDSHPNGGYYDCVFAQTGNPSGVLDGVNARVSKDGDCDALYGNHNGRDEFFESIQLVFNTGSPYSSIYEARDCDPSTPGLQRSPRLVTIVVLEEPTDVNTPEPIIAFAGMFIGGCGDERLTYTDEAQLDPYCGPKSVANLDSGDSASDLYVGAPELGYLPKPNACHRGTPHGQQTCPASITPTPSPTPSPTASPTKTPTPSPTKTPSPTPSKTPTPTPAGPTPTPSPTPAPVPGCPPGHCTVFARFVNLITAGGDVVPSTDQTTLFGISLVE